MKYAHSVRNQLKSILVSLVICGQCKIIIVAKKKNSGSESCSKLHTWPAHRSVLVNFSGITFTSTLDYPGKISTVLFATGCNFQCEYCHNLSTLHEILFTGDEIFHKLLRRKKFIHALVISGGEPTIQSDLIAFVRKLKNAGFLIKLDTNGSNPRVLHKLLSEKLLSFVAMDLKAPMSRYRSIACKNTNLSAILESIRLLRASNIPHEFRTTVLPEFTVQILLDTAWPAFESESYCLQPFQPVKEYYDSFSLEHLSGISQIIRCALPQLCQHFKQVTVRNHDTLFDIQDETKTMVADSPSSEMRIEYFQ